MLRLVSWNVNGFRAMCQKEAWHKWIDSSHANVIGLQETKATPEQIVPEERNPSGWNTWWASSVVKKGYSGVAVFVRQTELPLCVNVELPCFQGEGRLLHLEFSHFHFFNIYFPNGGQSPERLAYKLNYYDAFLEHIQKLKKPLVICGDFNTAHRPLDLANPKENEDISGFLPIERAWIDRFIAAGYVDTFRAIHGDELECYTWWSYRMRARTRNIGWRIDYFFISQELLPVLHDAWIEKDITGSDHCPIGIDLDLY